MSKKVGYKRSFTSRTLRKVKQKTINLPKNIYYSIKNPKKVKKNFVKKHPITSAGLGLAGSLAAVIALRLGAPILVGSVTKKIGKALKGSKSVRYSKVGGFSDAGMTKEQILRAIKKKGT